MPQSPTQSRSQYRWCLLGIGFSVFLFTLDLSIVNVALPSITKQLSTDFTTVQWVVLSYLLVVAGLLPGAARLGDLKDKKRLYLFGLVVFTAASLLCGISPNVEILIASRAIQGIGALFVSALGIAIVTSVAPEEERGKAIGTVGGLISIGVAVGPTLGGIILKVTSWHWIFLVNVPLGIACFFLLKRHLPALEPEGETDSSDFDFPGLALLAGTLTAIDLGMLRVQRGGPTDLWAGILLGAGVLGVVAVIWWERRHSAPLISLDMFENVQFSLGLGLALLVFIVLAGSLFLMPFFLERVLDYETFKVGLLLAVAPVTAGLVSPLSGTLADRVGERPVSVVGLLLLATGCFAISRFHQDMSEWRFVLSYLPFGLGVGVFQAANNSSIMGSADRTRIGTASGLLSLSRTMGQSLGIPIMATSFLLISSGGAAQGGSIEALSSAELVQGLNHTFLGAGILLALAAVSAWGISASSRK